MISIAGWKFWPYYCIQIKGAAAPLYAFRTKGEAELYLKVAKYVWPRYELEIKRRRLSVERRLKDTKVLFISTKEIEIPAERLEILE